MSEIDLNDRSTARGLYRETVGMFSAGLSGDDAVKNLSERGIPEEQAFELVSAVHADMMRQVSCGVSYVPALIGGISTASIGGILWGMIVTLMGAEIGYMAWGMGIIVGLAVVICGGGQKGHGFQVIAVACSVFGILIGKYITVVYFAKKALETELGAAAANAVSYLSPGAIMLVFTNLTKVLGLFDLLWFALAIVTTWRICDKRT